MRMVNLTVPISPCNVILLSKPQQGSIVVRSKALLALLSWDDTFLDSHEIVAHLTS
jgi:hypothetical protein